MHWQNFAPPNFLPTVQYVVEVGVEGVGGIADQYLDTLYAPQGAVFPLHSSSLR